MSEFEKELMNKVSPHDRTYNGNELFLGGVLAEHFKDWHSAGDYEILKEKLDKVYTILGFLVKAHDELWTVTDGRGQFENALDEAKKYLEIESEINVV